MPWKGVTVSKQRQRFLADYQLNYYTVTELAERFSISRKTAHKWIRRFKKHGQAGLSFNKTGRRIHPIFHNALPISAIWIPKSNHSDGAGSFGRAPFSRGRDKSKILTRYASFCEYNRAMDTIKTLSPKAQKIYSQISEDTSKFGDLKKIGKEIKKDHDLAMELWSMGEYYPRLLAVLILDKNLLTQEIIDKLAADMTGHEYDERNRLADWLLANQLTKAKKTIALIETWEHNPSPVLRRLFWYFQARLRWTGKTPPDNAASLLASLQKNMAKAEPEVQWAMNFSAAQIGIHEPKYRSECIELGERLGLYKDDPVAKNCTPDYLPEFIRIETAKRSK